MILLSTKERLRIFFLRYDYVPVPVFFSSGNLIAFFDMALLDHFLYLRVILLPG